MWKTLQRMRLSPGQTVLGREAGQHLVYPHDRDLADRVAGGGEPCLYSSGEV